MAAGFGAMLHVPPAMLFVRPSVSPGQTGTFPPMAVGVAFTVIIAVLHPHAVVYVTCVVPAAVPVTTPAALIVAVGEEVMLHAPPATALLSGRVVPVQIGALPVIGPGAPFTVTAAVVAPQAVVYVTIAVPGLMPPTSPVALTVATTIGAMLHVPPGGVLASAVVLPAHRLSVPDMGAVRAFTVTIVFTLPHILV